LPFFSTLLSRNLFPIGISGFFSIPQVILNKGTGEGYRVGLRISIERTTQTVKDPQTGKVIRQITQPIGTLEIVEADNQSSVGRVITGSSFKIGDLAKPIR
jgi:hypothetical protein